MRSTLLIAIVLLIAPQSALHATDVPQSVTELWTDFDPRQEPLEVEVVREWKSDGSVYRIARFVFDRPLQRQAGSDGSVLRVSRRHDGQTAGRHAHAWRRIASVSGGSENLCQSWLRGALRELGQTRNGRGAAERSEHRLGCGRSDSAKCSGLFQSCVPGAASQRNQRLPRLDGRRLSHQRADQEPADTLCLRAAPQSSLHPSGRHHAAVVAGPLSQSRSRVARYAEVRVAAQDRRRRAGPPRDAGSLLAAGRASRCLLQHRPRSSRAILARCGSEADRRSLGCGAAVDTLQEEPDVAINQSLLHDELITGRQRISTQVRRAGWSKSFNGGRLSFLDGSCLRTRRRPCSRSGRQ